MRFSPSPASTTTDRIPPEAWRYYGLLAVALILVLATAIISLRSTVLLRESIDAVGHSQRVLRGLSDSEAAMAEQEAALRAFLQDTNGELDSAFVAADERMLAEARMLGALLDDNDQRGAPVRLLTEAADTRSRISRSMVAMHGSESPSGSERQMDELRNAAASRSYRAALLAMRSIENRILETGRSAMLAQLDRTRNAIVVAGGLAAVSGVLGLWLLRRSRIAWKRQVVAELEASRARRQNEEKSMFLANISHEIRTPMNAIFGFSQLLGDVASGERERQYARSITSAGRALLSLVNDILDLTKIEAGKLEIDALPIDPRELVDGTLILFTQLAADKGLHLRADIADNTPTQVLTDPVRLRQVLTNLVGNAIKYTDCGGVLVRMWSSAGIPPPAMNLHLSVEDSGIGIAGDKLEQIFQPFVQTGGIGPRREGTGLGLSISRRLVELMGGQIRVASEPGRGSVFEVVLPYDPEAPAVAAAPPPAAALRPDALAPLKLLIVDDIDLNRELITALFDGSHHTVLEAADGAEAIVAVRRERPDVVLMDVRMPVMDGVTARARIRDDPALDTVKLIAVTASSLDDEERGLRASFDGYLRKPYTREEMVSEIARVLQVPINTPVVAAARPPAKPEGESVPKDARSSSPRLTPARVAFAPEVAATLAQMAGPRWHELTRSLAMRDIGAFADEVAALASADTLPALHHWARRLRNAVDLFDVTTAESVLGRYPTHLREAGIDAAKEK
jgi:signal transduction histidine kinase/DNA-binding NarL/FixJ family response regulator